MSPTLVRAVASTVLASGALVYALGCATPPKASPPAAMPKVESATATPTSMPAPSVAQTQSEAITVTPPTADPAQSATAHPIVIHPIDADPPAVADQPKQANVTRGGSATQPIDVGPAVKLPYIIERFTREGPIAGVVAKIDLTDPRVAVSVNLADPRDPDGDGPAVGQLDTVSDASKRLDLSLAINASFFRITGNRTAFGKAVGYFVGNGAFPVGWHYSAGKLYSTPLKPYLRSAMVVHGNGTITLDKDLNVMPKDVKFAVSGNCKCLTAGQPTPPAGDTQRHPRTCVGLSADGKMLFLVVIDGRRPGWSRGVTLEELAVLMQSFGASDAINFDGGGSSVMVAKDLVTGAFSVLNKPSEKFAFLPDAVDAVERPVADVVGITIRPE